MGDRVTDTEAYLARHKEALRDEGAGGLHISDERICAALERGPKFERAELDHLASCADCRCVLAELGRELPALEGREGAWSWIRGLLHRPIWLGAGAAAAIAVVLVTTTLRPSTREYTARGVEQTAEPSEVALLATSAGGEQRDVKHGDTLQLGDRLGFVYGNTSGEYRSLVILGWNGQKLRWYYPEKPDGPAVAIDKAHAQRLPFDIALGENHVPGYLKIVAAFDVEPRTLAETMIAGEDPRQLGRGIRVFELSIRNPEAR